MMALEKVQNSMMVLEMGWYVIGHLSVARE